MKKIKQYQVGNLILRKQGNNLVFTGNKNARPPIQIVTAMIAVTKYLKWWDRDNLYDYVPIATVDLSATQRTIYVDGKKAMTIASTGNCTWACFSKLQIVGVINDWIYNHNYTIIAENAFQFIGMLNVQRIDDFVEFDDADFEEADKLFTNFMVANCFKRGAYSFKNEYFQKRTGLPSSNLVWLYLTNRASILEVPRIANACQKKDSIEFSIY